ncbi:energy transducer TonB [Lewinella sp. IMCC34183]|uniref:energy transducer TonB n=1 Tax=Lewinella sp. IMCC34183 TaxID=2248762 RepID=UPI000E261ED3|nr:energy transducer TonB [Lewinella sp. IMCC34183]
MHEQLPEDEIFKIVEQMPLFRAEACGQLEAYAERKACADQAMLEHIHQHITYPPQAREIGKEGLAVITFIVETDGSISNIRLARDPGGGLGEVALAAVEQMEANGARWEPGIQKGKPVRVLFHLPVKFQITGAN